MGILKSMQYEQGRTILFGTLKYVVFIFVFIYGIVFGGGASVNNPIEARAKMKKMGVPPAMMNIMLQYHSFH